MIRYITFEDLGDVSGQRVAVGEIGGIGFLCVRIPFARKNALPPNFFKTNTYTPDAGEQIDKLE